MKNRIYFFVFTLLLSFASLNLNAIEDEGGSMQVIIGKQGQPIATLEIPKQFFKSNTKFYSTAQVSVVNSKTGGVVFSILTDNSNLDLQALPCGNYIVEINLSGHSYRKSITF